MSIQVIKSDVPQPLGNYSEASLASGLVFAAGQLASDFNTGVPQEARKHPNFSVLRLGYQAADGLHSEKHGEDF